MNRTANAPQPAFIHAMLYDAATGLGAAIGVNHVKPPTWIVRPGDDHKVVRMWGRILDGQNIARLSVAPMAEPTAVLMQQPRQSVIVGRAPVIGDVLFRLQNAQRDGRDNQQPGAVQPLVAAALMLPANAKVLPAFVNVFLSCGHGSSLF